MTTQKKFNCLTNIEFEDWAFDKPKEEFESHLNLELAIIQKEARDYIMTEYNRRVSAKLESAKGEV